MKSYQTQSPIRVDLAGGTLDFWPLYSFLGPCTTTNIAVNLFTQVVLTPRSDQQIEIDIQDLSFKRSYVDKNDFLSSRDPETVLVRAHVDYWAPRQGFSLETRSQSPVGGGLGGSSSLTISLIKAFSQWLTCPLCDEDMVRLASNIEARVLNVPTGTQDYYPALYGGLNVIDYLPARVQWQVRPISHQGFSEAWSQSAILVYTGQPHQSGLNNWAVYKAAVERDERTLTHLKRLQVVAAQMRECVVSGKWNELPELFNAEYEARVGLSEHFASPTIHSLRSVALRANARAVKICGAGGGGCVLVWASPETRAKVEEACESEGFQVLKKVSPVGVLPRWDQPPVAEPSSSLRV